MNIVTIPLKNMRRKPTKTLLLLFVFLLGVISIVALYQVSLVVGHSLEKKLTAFGANIVVKPSTETLSVSYGGFHMGDMLLDVKELQEAETTAAIKSIGYKDRISVVAPKLVNMFKVDEMAIAVALAALGASRDIFRRAAECGKILRSCLARIFHPFLLLRPKSFRGCAGVSVHDPRACKKHASGREPHMPCHERISATSRRNG